ncbi:hypothetical protein HYH02_014651 [Chlamydomonas schloesseri]|uniref:Protein kinase domain-containing protein n=1 Tax=Chlamydomonas schloesseri TaxID=2026947 RepID=A0A835VVG6_9CHLO|nr:hypothetical protein HYH02_014651 [Chlamydomonas schloesseri]|eukprot:KAG2427004.1 hypothetical protein HYH02_014651 [Chlamydomonas schloesseri]
MTLNAARVLDSLYRVPAVATSMVQKPKPTGVAAEQDLSCTACSSAQKGAEGAAGFSGRVAAATLNAPHRRFLGIKALKAVCSGSQVVELLDSHSSEGLEGYGPLKVTVASAPELEPASATPELPLDVQCGHVCSSGSADWSPDASSADGSAGTSADVSEATSVLDCWEDFDTLPDIKGTTPPASVAGCTAPSSAASSSDCASPGSGTSAEDSSHSLRGGCAVVDDNPGAAAASCRGTESVSYYLENGRDRGMLGKGGFGRCDLYRVMGKDVVVKTLLPQQQCGSSMTAELQREAHGMRVGAACPYIVDLYATSQPSSLAEPHQLVMEYVSGGTLEDYVRKLQRSKGCKKLGKGRLMSYGLLRVLARQLCTALACLHSANVCHNDIKPENILVEIDGDVDEEAGTGVTFKLADFGMAQVAANDGSVPQVGGSLRWMAPETFSHYTRNLPDYPLLLNQDLAVAGYVLAHCGGLAVLKNAHLQTFKQEARLPESWDADFADLVLQLTARNPMERISAQAALQHPFITGRRTGVVSA